MDIPRNYPCAQKASEVACGSHSGRSPAVPWVRAEHQALRDLKVTLHREWTFQEIIPAPKKPQKLPVVLIPEEVLQFLGCVQSIKHCAILRSPFTGNGHSKKLSLRPKSLRSCLWFSFRKKSCSSLGACRASSIARS